MQKNKLAIFCQNNKNYNTNNIENKTNVDNAKKLWQKYKTQTVTTYQQWTK